MHGQGADTDWGLLLVRHGYSPAGRPEVEQFVLGEMRQLAEEWELELAPSESMRVISNNRVEQIGEREFS